SGLRLGCALARFLLDHVVPDGPVALVGDDTVDGHPGRAVYGKGRHRDAVRSSHAYTAWRYGHKWVVLAVLVKFPFAARRWALPVLVDLYRTPEVSKAEGARHRTPARLMCRLLRLMLLRFPDRSFVFTGDSGFGTHEVARFCHRHRGGLTLVSKCHPDINLFAPPPPYAGNGRPRVKGARVPKPRQAASTAARTRLTVVWYGGGTRRVEAATGTGHWYKGGEGLVPVRWVFVRDATGTHRDEYLFTTDPGLEADAVVAAYCGRWNIETTFQEARSALGLETTRGRCKPTVLRAGPCLSAARSATRGTGVAHRRWRSNTRFSTRGFSVGVAGRQNLEVNR
ncbi:transposase, partial [bacterium]|nr:transposase [bacterium]